MGLSSFFIISLKRAPSIPSRLYKGVCSLDGEASALKRSKRPIKRENSCARFLYWDGKMASSEEGQVISCHTLEQWKEQFDKGKESKKLVVVDFTASWCGPCRFISPILAECAKTLPNVIFLKVDVDELKVVAEEWEVEAMPTFIFFKEGNKVDKFVGAKKDELLQTIAKHASPSLPVSA